MTAAILYHRVSTLDQDPTLARAELERVAAARELPVLQTFEETGSGARNDRPQFQRALELAEDNPGCTFVVWKLDRFGRSALDILTNVQRLHRARCTFLCSSQRLEVGPAGGDPMSRVMLVVMAAFAELERELIRERTAAGIAKAKRAGKACHRPVSKSAPAPEQVRTLRQRGSWGWVARRLGCSVSAARRAALRGLPKGDPQTGGKLVDGKRPRLEHMSQAVPSGKAGRP